MYVIYRAALAVIYETFLTEFLMRFSPRDRTLTSAVILASASSSSWVRGRSRWAPLRLRGASWRSCKRRLVFLVCSLVDCRTDFRATEQQIRNGDPTQKCNLDHSPKTKRFSYNNDVLLIVIIYGISSYWFCLLTELELLIVIRGQEEKKANLLSAKSWNSWGILLLSSTLVFSVLFCSSLSFLGFGFGTFMGSLE